VVSHAPRLARESRAQEIAVSDGRRGAVAWLAAVLTWRSNGIDRIPERRRHEKLMEVDHHV
jgi:hypothetical protein